jgi:hypothetical protein
VCTCWSQWPRGLRHEHELLTCWDCGYKSRRRYGCLSLVSVVHCQAEASVSGC